MKKNRKKTAEALIPIALPPLDPRIPIGLALLVAVVYVYTLCPTVAGGDSGELITAAFGLGIAHPPGYPLFTLLGKVFTWLPVGSIAWRVNLLSAVCDTGAAVLLFLGVRRWSGSAWGGFLAASLFAFSTITWRHAVIAEVFALNNIFCAALFYLMGRFEERRDRATAYLAAFVFGLGLSNHHLLVFYGGPLVLAILYAGMKEKILGRREIAVAALLFAAGLLPYLYLPLAGVRLPDMMWGDMRSWDGLVTHLLRREYGTLKLSSDTSQDGLAGYGLRLFYYVKTSFGDLLWGGPLLAVLGLRSLPKRRFPWLRHWTLFVFFAYVLVFHALANLDPSNGTFRGVLERFWQEPLLILCAWVGLGFAALEGRFPRLRRPVVAFGVGAAVILTQLALHFTEVNQRDNYTFRDFARAILEPLPPGALLMTLGDTELNTTAYLQRAEGVRPDVKIVDQMLLSYTWYGPWMDKHHPELRRPGVRLHPDEPDGFSSIAFAASNYGRLPVFACSGLYNPFPEPPPSDRELAATYKLLPIGFDDQIVTGADNLKIEPWIDANLKAFARFTPPGRAQYALTTWERFAFIKYWGRMGKLIETLLTLTDPLRDPKYYRLVAELMQNAVDKCGDETPAFWYRVLGTAYGRLSATDKARQYLKRYVAKAEAGDPEVGEARRVLSSLGN